jgi:hypothetical protein
MIFTKSTNVLDFLARRSTIWEAAMESAVSAAKDTAHIMQLALAPVFLISALGVLLTAMSQRYGRVIDRARTLLRDGNKLYGQFANMDHVDKELRSLLRRARILRSTIILASASIFLVVIAVMLVFIELMVNRKLFMLSELSFVSSLVVMLVAIVLFIEDFAISLQALKHDIKTRGTAGIIGTNEKTLEDRP